MSSVCKAVLVFVAAAGVYLVGNGRTQLFDRDEPRYAQCSRQMLQSGDWVVPRLYDRIRAAKPPGIYWCQATMMAVFGENAFAARMPSVLAGLLTVVVLAAALWKPLGPQPTVWTLFVFTSSALAIFCAKVSQTDSVLLLWTTIAFICVYLLWQGRGGWPAVIALSIAIGFAGLIKGPFIIGVLGSTVIVLGLLRVLDHWIDSRRQRGGPDGNGSALTMQREWASQPPGTPAVAVLARQATVAPAMRVRIAMLAMKFGIGALIVAAIITPWVVLVQHREPHFLLASTKDAVEHLESGAEGHKGPPGYHLATIWLTFLPWSLLLPMAIAQAFRNRRSPEIRFALAAVLGTWIFVEILQTKLPHYMLSAFPALAVLTADAIVRCLRGEARDLESRPMRAAALAWGLAALALATVPWWWIAFKFRDFDWLALLSLTVLGVCLPVAVNVLLRMRRPAVALACMGIGSMGLVALLFGIYFPRCQPLRLPLRIAQVLKDHDVVYPGQVKMLDYKEPSLAFYQGGTIREAKHSLETIEHLDTAPPWMVVSRQIWDQTPAEVRGQLQQVAEFKGLNYSDSLRPADVLVVKKK